MDKVEQILGLLDEFETLTSDFARSEESMLTILNEINESNPNANFEFGNLFDADCPAGQTREDVAAADTLASLSEPVLLDLTKAVYNTRFYRNAAKDAEAAYLTATTLKTRSQSRAVRVWADMVSMANNEAQEHRGKNVILRMLLN